MVSVHPPAASTRLLRPSTSLGTSGTYRSGKSLQVVTEPAIEAKGECLLSRRLFQMGTLRSQYAYRK